MTKHPDYNTDKFPSFVAHHGNWDLYINDRGYCAAIPTAKGEKIGCIATHFGDFQYTRMALSKAIETHYPEGGTNGIGLPGYLR